MNGKRGLGRGLGALIPTAPSGDHGSVDVAPANGQNQQHNGVQNGADTGPETVAGPDPYSAVDTQQVETGAFFAELPLDSIRPNARQPRQVFEEAALAELVASITEVGLLQPVVVRPVVGEPTAYELVMGERRWRASQRAGLSNIPAIVRNAGDDQMLRDALLENLHRAQLNPLEEAAAYQQLLDDFGCTHDELAGRLGRSRPQITNTLRLLRLSPAVQRRVAAGVLSAGHARALVSVPDPAAQDRLAHRTVAEGLSVRALEEAVTAGVASSTNGTDTARQPRVASSRPVAPGLQDLADRLSERLDTRVRVDLGKRKGRITVEFATLDDLERIISVLDPHTATES
ncbi:ParB/RepB/Spo0J family partition protein [soil metagenome]